MTEIIVFDIKDFSDTGMAFADMLAKYYDEFTKAEQDLIIKYFKQTEAIGHFLIKLSKELNNDI